MMRFKNENAVKCYKSHLISVWGGLALIIFSALGMIVELAVFARPTSLFTVMEIFYIIIGIVLCFGGLAHIVSYSVLDDCDEKELKKLDEEMSNGEWFAAPRMYLTESYVISLAAEPKWIEYKDILMVYKDSFSMNGLAINKGVTVLNKNGREKAFCGILFPIFKKRGWKYDKEVDAAFVKIKEKNPNVFVGYDPNVLEQLKDNAD
ncbi:MAG: hypothetical protein IJR45_05115 [Firmicutes bacterium]|nr:hypothetical protein [Bacillota bacterium]